MEQIKKRLDRIRKSVILNIRLKTNKEKRDKMKVKNMTNDNGRAIPNQFIIGDLENHTIYFQSYDSIIIKKSWDKGKLTIILDERFWNCSRTTSKYRSRFLGETTKETEKKIKSGIYQLADLNE